MNRDDRQSSAGDHREEIFPEVADTERMTRRSTTLKVSHRWREAPDQHEADAHENGGLIERVLAPTPCHGGRRGGGWRTHPRPINNTRLPLPMVLEPVVQTCDWKSNTDTRDQGIARGRSTHLRRCRQIQEAEHRQTTGDRQEQASQAHELPCTMSHMAVSVPWMVPLKSEVQVGDRCAP